MSFVKTPVRGMPEQTPRDMELREYALGKIKSTYKKYGFTQIETPAVEHIENLTSKQGGENEQLIFKILKRGEKLQKSENFDDLCDCGLRYDLSVPLARFYANNSNDLPNPFKALQTGPVWRADSPQKGRYRQFTQCDIDILGDATNLAEMELITATANMLYELGLGGSKVRVNDRRILKAMASFCGFPEEKHSVIFIILDKYDKIGLEGVKKSLLELGLEESGVESYCKFFNGSTDLFSCRDYFRDEWANVVPENVISNLEDIIATSRDILSGKGQVVFDPTLVRGMSYYTGPIFEIELSSYKLSVAGGGRYDEMIGKYSGGSTPACGFSIGFERIIDIMKNNETPIGAGDEEKIAYLITREAPLEKKREVLQKAAALREAGVCVLVSMRNKNFYAQKDKLRLYGYTKFVDVYPDTRL